MQADTCSWVQTCGHTTSVWTPGRSHGRARASGVQTPHCHPPCPPYSIRSCLCLCVSVGWPGPHLGRLVVANRLGHGDPLVVWAGCEGCDVPHLPPRLCHAGATDRGTACMHDDGARWSATRGQGVWACSAACMVQCRTEACMGSSVQLRLHMGSRCCLFVSTDTAVGVRVLTASLAWCMAGCMSS